MSLIRLQDARRDAFGWPHVIDAVPPLITVDLVLKSSRGELRAHPSIIHISLGETPLQARKADETCTYEASFVCGPRL